MSQKSKHIDFSHIELNFASSDDGAPEWVHILSTDKAGVVQTVDSRGPWVLKDAEAVAARSLAAEGGRLLIDVNHATDHAAPKGGAAPAVGWVVELAAREDGIWGRVEWNDEGRRLVASKSYRALSPAILVTKAKEVFAVPRLSLTNTPNLRGLAALNQETEMNLLQKIAEMLGLSAEASEDEVTAALEKALKSSETKGEGDVEMNAALPKLATALGLDQGADIATVLNAVETAPKQAEVAALQGDLAKVTVQLNAMQAAAGRKEAEAFVDAAIAAGRVGVKPQRERLIKMHLNSREDTEALINSMPTLNGQTLTAAAPDGGGDAKLQLNAAQVSVAAQLGMSAEDYAAALAADKKEGL